MIRKEEGIAVKVLENLRVDLQEVRTQFIRMLMVNCSRCSFPNPRGDWCTSLTFNYFKFIITIPTLYNQTKQQAPYLIVKMSGLDLLKTAVLHPDIVDFIHKDTDSIFKEKVWNCIQKLRQQQFDGGLRVKKLKGITKKVWEARINQCSRLIFTYEKSRQPETGQAQVYIAVQDICLDHDDVSRRAKARRRTPDAEWLDAELLEAVGSVECDRNALKPAEQSALDAAQAEELVIAPDFTDELLGNIQWRVLESEEQWHQAIIQQDADLPLKLTPEEHELVKLQGNLLLSGSAGTGKTTVSLYRLLQSLHDSLSGKRLYVAYNPLLVNNAQEQFKRLVGSSNGKLEAAFEFKTLRDLCLEVLAFSEQTYIIEDEVNFQSFWQLYRGHPKQKQYPTALVWDEIRSIIKGGQLSTDVELLSAKDYEKLSKKRSTIIPQKERREEVYKLAQWYQTKLKESGRFDEIDLTRKVLQIIKRSEVHRYQMIVCDEVQDFTELQLELLLQLCAPDGQLFFAGDLHQMISPSGFRWEELKEKFYRSHREAIQKTLNFNLRSVGSLVYLANQVLKLRSRLLKVPVVDVFQPCLNYGVPARLIAATPETMKLTLGQLNPGDAILVRTDTDKDKFSKDWKSSFIFTIEEAKGLEFDTVFLVGFFQLYQELWGKALRNSLLQDKEKHHLQLELNLLYVAITRARRILNIWEFKPSQVWSQSELEGCVVPLNPELVRAERVEATTECWRERGLYYLKAEFYRQALECFEKSGDIQLQHQAKAKMLVQQREYGKAAEIFAQLQDWQDSARLFEREKQWQRAAKCWANTGNFQKQQTCEIYALEAAGQWEEAAQNWEVLERFEDAKRCRMNIPEKKAEYRAIELEQKQQWLKAAHQYELAGLVERAEECRTKIQPKTQSVSTKEQIQLTFSGLHKQENGTYEIELPTLTMSQCCEEPQESYNLLSKGAAIKLYHLYSEPSLEKALIYLARSIKQHDAQSYNQEINNWIAQTNYLMWENQAVELKKAGNFAGAMKIYDEMFVSKPHFSRIHYSTLKTLTAANRLEEAYQAIQLWCLAVIPKYVFQTSGRLLLNNQRKSPLQNLFKWAAQDQIAMYHLGTMKMITSGSLSPSSTRAYITSLAGRNVIIQHDKLKARKLGIDTARALPWDAIADEVADSDIWDKILLATSALV